MSGDRMNTNKTLFDRTIDMYGVLLHSISTETRNQFNAGKNVNLDEMISRYSSCEGDKKILSDYAFEYHQLCKFSKNSKNAFDKAYAPYFSLGRMLAFGSGVIAGAYLGSQAGSATTTILGGILGGLLTYYAEGKTAIIANHFHVEPIPNLKEQLNKKDEELWRNTIAKLIPYTQTARNHQGDRILSLIFSDELLLTKESTQ